MTTTVTSLHHPDEGIHGMFSISYGTLNREGCHHYLLKMTPDSFYWGTHICLCSHWQGHSFTVIKATSLRFQCILKSSWVIPDWVTVGLLDFPCLTIGLYWNRWITAYKSLRPVSLGPWLMHWIMGLAPELWAWLTDPTYVKTLSDVGDGFWHELLCTSAYVHL